MPSATAAAGPPTSSPRGFDGIEEGDGGDEARRGRRGAGADDDEGEGDGINKNAARNAETTRKNSTHVLPWLFATSMTCYLDRGNIAYAAAQLNRDLGFSRKVYGIGSGVFFISYILLEIPSNIALVRVGPARWLSRILITWGVAASAMVGAAQAESS
jgi:sugar phosphate permease